MHQLKHPNCNCEDNADETIVAVQHATIIKLIVNSNACGLCSYDILMVLAMCMITVSETLKGEDSIQSAIETAQNARFADERKLN